MSKPLAFGLNLKKKPGASKPAAPKRRLVFGGDDGSDEDGAKDNAQVEQIAGDLDDDFGNAVSQQDKKKVSQLKGRPPTQPPKMKANTQQNAMFGDLSSSLMSRKNAEAASELDSSVYEYDAVYDSLKAKKPIAEEDKERKPKYMRNLLQAAEVRKRDALIAEEKKIAREREAEGDEYADKEKFVTEAYRKQQEENKRIEEEEKRREEEEAKKNKGGGMSAFYRNMLNRDEQRHSEAMKAAEEHAKDQPTKGEDVDEEAERERREADHVKELNEKGASIAVNADGQVVDKRQLLKGGLNVGAKKQSAAERERREQQQSERERRPATTGVHVGGKRAMRERQSEMLAAQLEQSLKRSREDEEAQRQEVERTYKSRKTEGEISSAKEKYLARKRAAEEAKKKATAE
jgi:hypothetical protein